MLNSSSPACSSHPVESLEQRFMLSAPRITSIVADNRGLVVLTLDQPLNPATVNTRSAGIYTNAAGKDRKVKSSVSISADNKQITIGASFKPDTPYKIYLSSKQIKNAGGEALDGEFVKAGKKTGNGKAGGDLLVQVKPAPTSKQIARFTTVMGNIDVRLLWSATPKTVQNFLSYANASTAGGDAQYTYDNTFIHRSIPGFVVQGGGFRVVPPGTVFDDTNIQQIPQHAPVVNEPHANAPGNIRGTIAMAKLGNDANSATNQWFFNLADNRANLDNQNGGFTVFGTVTSKAGMAVLDKIAALTALQTVDSSFANSVFSDLPLRDGAAVQARGGTVVPNSDLVIVQRVAVLMNVSAAKK